MLISLNDQRCVCQIMQTRQLCPTLLCLTANGAVVKRAACDERATSLGYVGRVHTFEPTAQSIKCDVSQKNNQVLCQTSSYHLSN